MTGATDLLAALGYAVFQQSGGSLQLHGPAPDWMPPGPITDAFPFLEDFILDANEFWENPGARTVLPSEFWTQTNAAGEELHCCAIAIAGERRFLLIEHAGQRFQQMQSFVQYAHEATLARDQIAKLSHQLEDATQAKSEFLARMSHEIRTPMNAILGMADLLSETRLTADQSEYVRLCRSAGANLLNIIDDILDFSKVEAGQIELEKLAFQVANVVTEALDIAGVRARAKGLALTSRIDSAVPPRLIGDPGRLRQILLNLLGNATKFTDRGELSVLVSPHRNGPASLHFQVSDTGVGIPADRLATIFESFAQADASTTRRYGGTGLGLAISKRLVELMGGEIWAESTPGSGTTMHFTAQFSVAGAAAPEGPKIPANAVIPHPGRALRILLADDGEANRFLIRGYLKHSGCVIDEAENGALAVERFKQNAYDVVFMDTEMPELDGYAATRAIRAFEREQSSAPTPVFALTAHVLREARERSFAAGCTGHLTKPISKETLIGAINAALPASLVTDQIPVSVESWLKPVVGAYLEKSREDVLKLRDAASRADLTTVRKLGHQFAGTGGGFGFDPITEIGLALEQSALSGDVARVQMGIEDLDRYLNAVRVE